jgi:hypothetical protein
MVVAVILLLYQYLYYQNNTLAIESMRAIEEERCVDSDGGVNYYERGNTNPRPCYQEPCPSTGVWTDECLDSRVLLEYSCKNLGGEIYTCPYRCEDGACIENP